MISGADDRRADALAAGKKRSVKDRLGVRKGGGGGGDGHGMHRHHDVATGKGDVLIEVEKLMLLPLSERVKVNHGRCQVGTIGWQILQLDTRRDTVIELRFVRLAIP